MAAVTDVCGIIYHSLSRKEAPVRSAYANSRTDRPGQAELLGSWLSQAQSTPEKPNIKVLNWLDL